MTLKGKKGDDEGFPFHDHKESKTQHRFNVALEALEHMRDNLDGPDDVLCAMFALFGNDLEPGEVEQVQRGRPPRINQLALATLAVKYARANPGASVEAVRAYVQDAYEGEVSESTLRKLVTRRNLDEALNY